MFYFTTKYLCRGSISLFVLGLILLLNACSQYMYSPAAGTIPNLQKCGALHVQGSLGLKNPSFGASVALQYAATKNIGLQAFNTFSLPFRFTSTIANQNYQLSGTGYYSELGVGRFGFLPQRFNRKEGASIQLYGGVGLGGISTKIQGGDASRIADKSALNYRQAYLQPSTVLRHRYFDLGIGLRVGYVHFNKGRFWGDRQMFRTTYQFFSAKNKFVVLEPTIQLWTKPIQDVKIQLFFSATSMPVEVATNAVWGIGAQYPLDKIKRARKPNSFRPFYSSPSLSLPASSRFAVCKRAP